MPIRRDKIYPFRVTDDEMARLRDCAYRQGHTAVSSYLRDRLGMEQEKASGGPRIRAGRPSGVE